MEKKQALRFQTFTRKRTGDTYERRIVQDDLRAMALVLP
jgi:hypothetical protein